MKRQFTEEEMEMPNKHMKACLTLPGIRKIWINITRLYIFLPDRQNFMCVYIIHIYQEHKNFISVCVPVCVCMCL